jgi:glycosyltransferase involved in cell wall biosynthesis
LVIVGEGPHGDDLRRYAVELGIADRVFFAGAAPREQLPDLYASADAFVFASVTETQGMVLAEAMAAGSIVVAADVPQIRDVLGNGGLAVAPQAEAFARAIEGLSLEPGDELRERARTGAARFGHLEQARKVEAVYEQLTRTYVRSTIGS